MPFETQKAAAMTAVTDTQTQVTSLSDSLVAAQGEMQAILERLASQSQAIRDALVATGDAVAAIKQDERDVLWYGADPTGAKTSNLAFMRAINAGDGRVPAGTYLIDPTNPIILADGQSLVMDPNAVLIAKPNDAPKYQVLRVDGDDVTIQGGRIVGDRLKHTYTDTGDATRTHEWGYGLQVRGNRCRVSNIHISECTGDGIGVSGRDHVFTNVTCTKNRRQGMSAFSAYGLRVYDSEFSMTGTLLTDAAAPNGPCAGVDIEPDNATTVDVWFERCKFNGNRAGFLAWIRSDVGGQIDVTLKDCEMVGNANGVQAKALAGAITVNVNGCMLVTNRGSGLRIELGTTFNVVDNVFDGMGDRADFTLTGTDTRTKYDIAVYTGGKANVGFNRYV